MALPSGRHACCTARSSGKARAVRPQRPGHHRAEWPRFHATNGAGSRTIRGAPSHRIQAWRPAQLDVEILSPEAVVTVGGYDAVVLGSGVYAGHWLESAKQFVNRHETALASRTVFLFSCGPLGDPPKPAGEPVDVLDIEEATGAVDHRVFPGRLVKSELSLPEKLIVAAVRAPYGDFRPWGEITAWAEQIALTLRPQPVLVS